MTGNAILIAGGGSGIGLALARAFASRDNRVVIFGRSPEKLDAAVRWKRWASRWMPGVLEKVLTRYPFSLRELDARYET